MFIFIKPCPNTVQCRAVQCITVQYSAVQCSTDQYSALNYSAVQCSTVQCSAVQCGGGARRGEEVRGGPGTEKITEYPFGEQVKAKLL